MTLQKMKVYELAKDLGIESIALLERLKQLDIDVKSHMSSLGTEEIRVVRDLLEKERVAADKTAKAVAKKAKSTSTTDEKRVTSTVIRRRAKGAEDSSDSDESASIEEAAPKAKTTVRRKATTTKTTEETPKSVETATDTQPSHEAAPVKAAAKTVKIEQEPEVHAEEQAPVLAEPVESKAPPVSVEQTQTTVSAQPVEKTPEATVKAEPVTKTQHKAPAKAPTEPSAPASFAAQLQQVSASPATHEAAQAAPQSTATPKPGSFSFDIIKVIPKEKPASPTATAATRPVPRPGSVPLPVPRPKGMPKPAPGAGGSGSMGASGRPGFNRNTYHRPTGGPGGPGARGPGGPGGFGRGPGGPGGPGGFGRGPGMGGAPSPFPPITPADQMGSRHVGDKNRYTDEDVFKKKTGLGRGERTDQPVEDIKLLDYRAKKELIFLPKRKKVTPNRELNKTMITKPAEHKRVIRIEDSVTVADLANRMGVKATDVIKKLIGMGVMANMNQQIDFDTTTLIATEFGFEIENVAFKENTVISADVDKDENQITRPPIVTVMGHVDHGKTSLLDAIRKANVAAGEAGGITQHIGAYSVELDGRKITFIDTPGHAAFTQMRARGANVTDIVILVVAADDGIMPQTREAIDHSKSAGVPIIVAINKIDKPTANRERVLKELAELDLLPEEWGGQVMVVNVSALAKTGIKELLEGVLLQAEMLDLKANPDRMGEGSILEAKLDKNRGPTATVLVKRGTLRVGDTIVAGAFVGRVRAMTDYTGKNLKEIGPSMAAEILGLEGVPTSGDAFNIVKDEASARELQRHRLEEVRKREASKQGKLTLDEIFSKIQKGDLKELPIILKTDVFGSTEAVKDSLLKLSTPQVKVKILSAAVGGVTESDVLLASASNALILGFNVRPDTKARAVADQEGIEIKSYSIIYELIDDVKKAMAGLLPKKAVERYLGRAEVRDIFTIPSIGVIAGCSVVDGRIVRAAQVRLLRDSRVIYTGKLGSLRRFKDDAKEVAQGYECGIGIENYRDLKTGDIIEAFAIDMIAQELDAPIQEATAQA